MTPIRTPPSVTLGLDPDTRADLIAFVDEIKGRPWRHRLAAVAEAAAAEGIDVVQFGNAAEFAMESALLHAPPPQEPPELATRPQPEQIAWRLYRSKWVRHHLTPTIRDVQQACGYASTAPTQHILKNLVRIGLLEHLGNVSHAYRLPSRWR